MFNVNLDDLFNTSDGQSFRPYKYRPKGIDDKLADCPGCIANVTDHKNFCQVCLNKYYIGSDDYTNSEFSEILREEGYPHPDDGNNNLPFKMEDLGEGFRF